MTGSCLPRVPEGLRELMKTYTKEVLREKPTNLYDFSARYFEVILCEKMHHVVRKYEPPQSYETIMKNRVRQQVPLLLIYKIIPANLTELIKQFIKTVLKQNPENIYVFAAEYFKKLQIMKSHLNESTPYATYEKYCEEKLQNSKLVCKCGRILGSTFQEQEVESPKHCVISDGEVTAGTAANEKKNIIQKNAHTAQYMNSVYIIQRYFRKYLKQKKISCKLPRNNVVKESNPVTNPGNNNVSIIATQPTEKLNIRYIRAVNIIQRHFRNYITQKKKKNLERNLEHTNYNSPVYLKAIYIIQSRFRIYLTSKEINLQRSSINSYNSQEYLKAIFIIQRFFRRHLKRKNQQITKNEKITKENNNLKVTTAAFVIQRAFRKIMNTRQSMPNTLDDISRSKLASIRSMQGDEVNDAASEVASSSASTALLSSESICEREHTELGGNSYEEGVFQKIIKEDDEVESEHIYKSMNSSMECLGTYENSLNFGKNELDIGKLPTREDIKKVSQDASDLSISENASNQKLSTEDSSVEDSRTLHEIQSKENLKDGINILMKVENEIDISKLPATEDIKKLSQDAHELSISFSENTPNQKLSNENSLVGDNRTPHKIQSKGTLKDGSITLAQVQNEIDISKLPATEDIKKLSQDAHEHSISSSENTPNQKLSNEDSLVGDNRTPHEIQSKETLKDGRITLAQVQNEIDISKLPATADIKKLSQDAHEHSISSSEKTPNQKLSNEDSLVGDNRTPHEIQSKETLKDGRITLAQVQNEIDISKLPATEDIKKLSQDAHEHSISSSEITPNQKLSNEDSLVGDNRTPHEIQSKETLKDGRITLAQVQNEIDISKLPATEDIKKLSQDAHEHSISSSENTPNQKLSNEDSLVGDNRTPHKIQFKETLKDGRITLAQVQNEIDISKLPATEDIKKLSQDAHEHSISSSENTPNQKLSNEDSLVGDNRTQHEIQSKENLKDGRITLAQVQNEIDISKLPATEDIKKLSQDAHEHSISSSENTPNQKLSNEDSLVGDNRTQHEIQSKENLKDGRITLAQVQNEIDISKLPATEDIKKLSQDAHEHSISSSENTPNQKLSNEDSLVGDNRTQHEIQSKENLKDGRITLAQVQNEINISKLPATEDIKKLSQDAHEHSISSSENTPNQKLSNEDSLVGDSRTPHEIQSKETLKDGRITLAQVQNEIDISKLPAKEDIKKLSQDAHEHSISSSENTPNQKLSNEDSLVGDSRTPHEIQSKETLKDGRITLAQVQNEIDISKLPATEDIKKLSQDAHEHSISSSENTPNQKLSNEDSLVGDSRTPHEIQSKETLKDGRITLAQVQNEIDISKLPATEDIKKLSQDAHEHSISSSENTPNQKLSNEDSLVGDNRTQHEIQSKENLKDGRITLAQVQNEIDISKLPATEDIKKLSQDAHEHSISSSENTPNQKLSNEDSLVGDNRTQHEIQSKENLKDGRITLAQVQNEIDISKLPATEDIKKLSQDAHEHSISSSENTPNQKLSNEDSLVGDSRTPHEIQSKETLKDGRITLAQVQNEIDISKLPATEDIKKLSQDAHEHSISSSENTPNQKLSNEDSLVGDNRTQHEIQSKENLKDGRITLAQVQNEIDISKLPATEDIKKLSQDAHEHSISSSENTPNQKLSNEDSLVGDSRTPHEIQSKETLKDGRITLAQVQNEIDISKLPATEDIKKLSQDAHEHSISSSENTPNQKLSNEDSLVGDNRTQHEIQSKENLKDGRITLAQVQNEIDISKLPATEDIKKLSQDAHEHSISSSENTPNQKLSNEDSLVGDNRTQHEIQSKENLKDGRITLAQVQNEINISKLPAKEDIKKLSQDAHEHSISSSENTPNQKLSNEDSLVGDSRTPHEIQSKETLKDGRITLAQVQNEIDISKLPATEDIKKLSQDAHEHSISSSENTPNQKLSNEDSLVGDSRTPHEIQSKETLKDGRITLAQVQNEIDISKLPATEDIKKLSQDAHEHSISSSENTPNQKLSNEDSLVGDNRTQHEIQSKENLKDGRITLAQVQNEIDISKLPATEDIKKLSQDAHEHSISSSENTPNQKLSNEDSLVGDNRTQHEIQSKENLKDGRITLAQVQNEINISKLPAKEDIKKLSQDAHEHSISSSENTPNQKLSNEDSLVGDSRTPHEIQSKETLKDGRITLAQVQNEIDISKLPAKEDIKKLSQDAHEHSISSSENTPNQKLSNEDSLVEDSRTPHEIQSKETLKDGRITLAQVQNEIDISKLPATEDIKKLSQDAHEHSISSSENTPNQKLSNEDSLVGDSRTPHEIQSKETLKDGRITLAQVQNEIDISKLPATEDIKKLSQDAHEHSISSSENTPNQKLSNEDSLVGDSRTPHEIQSKETLKDGRITLVPVQNEIDISKLPATKDITKLSQDGHEHSISSSENTPNQKLSNEDCLVGDSRTPHEIQSKETLKDGRITLAQVQNEIDISKLPATKDIKKLSQDDHEHSISSSENTPNQKPSNEDALVGESRTPHEIQSKENLKDGRITLAQVQNDMDNDISKLPATKDIKKLSQDDHEHSISSSENTPNQKPSNEDALVGESRTPHEIQSKENLKDGRITLAQVQNEIDISKLPATKDIKKLSQEAHEHSISSSENTPNQKLSNEDSLTEDRRNPHKIQSKENSLITVRDGMTTVANVKNEKEQHKMTLTQEVDSSLHLSNNLIGTQNLSKPSFMTETDIKNSKLEQTCVVKDNKKGEQPKSQRLINAPIAELQLKSFKTPPDAPPWYEVHIEPHLHPFKMKENKYLNDRANNIEPVPNKNAVIMYQEKNQDKTTSEEENADNFFFSLNTERFPKYISVEQSKPDDKTKPAAKSSISFFVPFDSNDGKPKYKIPKKFLKFKTDDSSQNSNINDTSNSNYKVITLEEFMPAHTDLKETEPEEIIASFGNKLQTIPELNENEPFSENKLRRSDSIEQNLNERYTEDLVVSDQVASGIPLVPTDPSLEDNELVTLLKQAPTPPLTFPSQINGVNEIDLAKKHRAAIKIQKYFQKSFGSSPSKIKTREAAVKIQRHYRKYIKCRLQELDCTKASPPHKKETNAIQGEMTADEQEINNLKNNSLTTPKIKVTNNSKVNLLTVDSMHGLIDTKLSSIGIDLNAQSEVKTCEDVNGQSCNLAGQGNVLEKDVTKSGSTKDSFNTDIILHFILKEMEFSNKIQQDSQRQLLSQATSEELLYEVIEDPCIKKSVSLSNINDNEATTNESKLENSHSNSNINEKTSDLVGDLPEASQIQSIISNKITNSDANTLLECTKKLSKPDKVIEKMSQRRTSELQKNPIDKNHFDKQSFQEPPITYTSLLPEQNEINNQEDSDIVIYNNLKREFTRESSGKSDSLSVVVIGISDFEAEMQKINSAKNNKKKPQLIRHHTIAGENAQNIFQSSSSIDETAKFLDAERVNSFYLDDETSENIREKMMAFSLSEADSDYFDPNRAVNDDFHINTILADTMGTSTDTESTIVSAATKIQAGARGFLTRRRLRRASAGTKSSTQETKASFGNDAISESLERFIEEEAARKIQTAYRIHYYSRKRNGDNDNMESFIFGNSLAARRQTLQRGDALRNNSTPDDENGSNTTDQIAENIKQRLEKTKGSSVKNDTKLRWFALRQNSMPVQIECQVFRIIPKHMRKRIKSAESARLLRK